MTDDRNTIRDASLYDKVPYPNRPQRIAHPRHLEAVATLFGMAPQPVPQCAVLELGSATGLNLIAQAYDLPKSNFLGIDFSEVQMAEGQKTIKTLGLENVELRHANIMDVEPTWGQIRAIHPFRVPLNISVHQCSLAVRCFNSIQSTSPSATFGAAMRSKTWMNANKCLAEVFIAPGWGQADERDLPALDGEDTLNRTRGTR